MKALPLLAFLAAVAAAPLALAPAALAETTPSQEPPAKEPPTLALSAADPCTPHILREEVRRGVPANLLRAISLAESGKWNPETRDARPWPWTVMAEGDGVYHPTKEAALAAVKALRARGVRSIDIGCMQMNLIWHAQRFSSIEEAFEPARNVAAAADYLSELREQRGDWYKAAGYYHSATPEFFNRYSAKVMSLLSDLGGSRPDLAPEGPADPTLAMASLRQKLPAFRPAWARPATAGSSPGSGEGELAGRFAPKAGPATGPVMGGVAQASRGLGMAQYFARPVTFQKRVNVIPQQIPR